MREVGGERRGLERFDLKIPARIRIPTAGPEKEIELLTEDISSGGAFFHTSEPLAEGTDVKINLILPLKKLIKILEQENQGFISIHIQVSGRVLRTESSGMAVSFDKDYEISPWEGENTAFVSNQ